MSEARAVPSRLPVEGIKRLLALVILSCFFLPLAQCTYKEKAAPAATVHAPASPPAAPTRNDFVPYHDLTFSDGSGLIAMLPFVWPLALAAARRGRHTSRPWQWSVNGAEIVLAGASALYVYNVGQIWGELRYGGILALSAYGAHTLLSVLVLVSLARTRTAQHRQ